MESVNGIEDLLILDAVHGNDFLQLVGMWVTEVSMNPGQCRFDFPRKPVHLWKRNALHV